MQIRIFFLLYRYRENQISKNLPLLVWCTGGPLKDPKSQVETHSTSLPCLTLAWGGAWTTYGQSQCASAFLRLVIGQLDPTVWINRKRLSSWFVFTAWAETDNVKTSFGRGKHCKTELICVRRPLTNPDTDNNLRNRPCSLTVPRTEDVMGGPHWFTRLLMFSTFQAHACH